MPLLLSSDCRLGFYGPKHQVDAAYRKEEEDNVAPLPKVTETTAVSGLDPRIQSTILCRHEPDCGCQWHHCAVEELCKQFPDRVGCGCFQFGRLSVNCAAGRTDGHGCLHRGFETAAACKIQWEIIRRHFDGCEARLVEDAANSFLFREGEWTRIVGRHLRQTRHVLIPACRGTMNHGFARGSRQHTKTRRPPGRSAVRIFANEISGRAKNITPKRENSRSVLSRSKGKSVASASMNSAPVRDAMASPRQHRCRDVDAEHLAGAADLTGEFERRLSAAAADVDDVLAGRRRGPLQNQTRDRAKRASCRSCRSVHRCPASPFQ